MCDHPTHDLNPLFHNLPMPLGQAPLKNKKSYSQFTNFMQLFSVKAVNENYQQMTYL